MKGTARVVILAIAVGFVGFVPLTSSPAAAHEHVTVGEYELIVGWRTEPAVTGSLNGLDLGIEHHLSNGTTVWVLHAENNLTAELSSGTARVTKDLVPQFGRDGWYTFDLIPTRAAAYSVRLTGDIEGTLVNVAVDLDPVGPASDLAFPVADPTASELQARLDATQWLLIVALVIAFIGLGVGAISFSRLRKRAGGPETPP